MTTSSTSSPRSDGGDWEPQPLDAAGVSRSTTFFEYTKGDKVTWAFLEELLPDIETALFFGKVFNLGWDKLSEIIHTLFQSDVIDALLGEDHVHSHELQDYVIGVVPDWIQAQHGAGHYDEVPPPDTELLAQLVKAGTLEVAKSLQDVADSLNGVLSHMPSKFGTMTFSHMRELNRQHGAIGTYAARVVHEQVPDRLVVLDVSGSMTEETIRRIVDEVVGMAYSVNASLAIVSNDAFLWEAGTYDTDTVLQHAQYSGTHYEMLTPIFDRDWDTVITIADYDSGWVAQDHIATHAKGRVRSVLDISLVNRPTFLAECIGRIADEVKPLVVGHSRQVMVA